MTRTSLFFIFACCFNLRLYYNIWFVFHHKKSSSNLYISFLLTKNVCYISICLYKKKEECKNVHTKCWQIQIVPLPQPYVTLVDAWLSSQGALVLFFFATKDFFRLLGFPIICLWARDECHSNIIIRTKSYTYVLTNILNIFKKISLYRFSWWLVDIWTINTVLLSTLVYNPFV